MRLPGRAFWLGIPLLLLALGGLYVALSLRFDAPNDFWAQKGELERVLVSEAEGDSLYEAFELTMISSAGYEVRGYLRVPRAAGSWPALVVIGGVRTGKMAAELVTPPQPYVILGLDYPWDGPTQPSWWEFAIRVRHLDLRRRRLRSAFARKPSGGTALASRNARRCRSLARRTARAPRLRAVRVTPTSHHDQRSAR
jgi:hypothetical protein